MYGSPSVSVFLATAYTVFASLTPSPAQLGDITILASDDLRSTKQSQGRMCWHTSLTLGCPEDERRLVAQDILIPSHRRKGLRSIGESLWSTSKQDFNAGLNS
jgi:hypothetical protein